MSTTFEVIRVNDARITFNDVIELSQKKINLFLANLGINKTLALNVNLHENNEKYVQNIDLSTEFKWEENEYAWFTLTGVKGGTDAYCFTLKDEALDPNNPWWRLEEMEENNNSIENFPLKIEEAKIRDRMWSLRRSVGQPAIINLAYGLIASSIAELTSGILWSDDGAWNFERFPTEHANFDKWYFNPHLESNVDNASWARECISLIPQELEGCH